MYAERHTVTLTADGSGAATGYSPVVTGPLSQIRYVKTDFDNGVDFTITAEATGETLWTQSDVNASATVAPRQAAHSTAGVAATLDGTRPMLDKIVLAKDRVKIVVGSAGAGKVGTFHIVVG